MIPMDKSIPCAYKLHVPYHYKNTYNICNGTKLNIIYNIWWQWNIINQMITTTSTSIYLQWKWDAHKPPESCVQQTAVGTWASKEVCGTVLQTQFTVWRASDWSPEGFYMYVGWKLVNIPHDLSWEYEWQARRTPWLGNWPKEPRLTGLLQVSTP